MSQLRIVNGWIVSAERLKCAEFVLPLVSTIVGGGIWSWSMVYHSVRAPSFVSCPLLYNNDPGLETAFTWFSAIGASVNSNYWRGRRKKSLLNTTQWELQFLFRVHCCTTITRVSKWFQAPDWRSKFWERSCCNKAPGPWIKDLWVSRQGYLSIPVGFIRSEAFYWAWKRFKFWGKWERNDHRN